MFSSAFLLASLYAATSYAVPLELSPRGIDGGLFATLNLMEQYSAAAYCPWNSDNSKNALTCDDDLCPEVQNAGATAISEFANTPSYDTTGFVAVDDANKLIVISFRGSSSIDNWVADLSFAKTGVPLCSGCNAHEGFWGAWGESRTVVTNAVNAALSAHPSYSLVATGHSLGGAIAALCAAELRNAGHTVALYTYGSPRIGDQALSSYITNQPGGNYRVTHYDDIVPRVPPQDFGFAHVSPEYWINKPDGETAQPSDVSTCSGTTNGNCNGSFLIPSISAHLWYFESISNCVFGSLKLVKRF